MLASNTYNSLEAWAECDNRRLTETSQKFSRATRRSPPTYTTYLEIGHPSSSIYTFHVKNTDLSSWLGHLLIDTSIDDIPLYTDFVNPVEGHEVIIHQVAKLEGHDVHGASPSNQKADEEDGGPKMNVAMPIRAVEVIDTLSAPNLNLSPLLTRTMEGSLGEIEVSIFRGESYGEPPWSDPIRSKGNREAGKKISFRAFDEDHVDPWVRFVFIYGTRVALEANGIALPEPAMAPTRPLQLEIPVQFIPPRGGGDDTGTGNTFKSEEEVLRVLVPATPESGPTTLELSVKTDPELAPNFERGASITSAEDDTGHLHALASLLDPAIIPDTSNANNQKDQRSSPEVSLVLESNISNVEKTIDCEKVSGGRQEAMQVTGEVPPDLLAGLPDLPPIEIDEDLREIAEAMTASQVDALTSCILEHAIGGAKGDQGDRSQNQYAGPSRNHDYRGPKAGSGIVLAQSKNQGGSPAGSSSGLDSVEAQARARASGTVERTGRKSSTLRPVTNYQRSVTGRKITFMPPLDSGKAPLPVVRSKDFAYPVSVPEVPRRVTGRVMPPQEYEYLKRKPLSKASFAACSRQAHPTDLNSSSSGVPLRTKQATIRRSDKDGRKHLANLDTNADRKPNTLDRIPPSKPRAALKLGKDGKSFRRTETPALDRKPEIGEIGSRFVQKRINDYPKKSAFAPSDHKRRRVQEEAPDARHVPVRSYRGRVEEGK
ncbi:hypothetical protein IAT40_000487 [Kwoniella sp. CBS 6097]